MKPKQFYLEIPIWRAGCWIVWPVTKQQAEDWFTKQFKLEPRGLLPHYDNADACTYSGNPCVIFLPKWKFDPENIANLTHECVHVATYILENCGVKEKESCDEALAYLIGFLVESFLVALKQKH
jgi:hypothetical protein